MMDSRERMPTQWRRGPRYWPRWIQALFPLGIAAAFAIVFISGSATAIVPAADHYETQKRTYYIAADEVDWNYAPAGINQITGEPFDATAAVFTERGPQRIGTTYIKSLYQEYTDATFSARKPRSAEDQHLGMLGPVIRAVVGDTIEVVFKNNLDRPAAVHAHGLFYDKASEGAPYDDGTSPADRADDAVAPGAVYTYSYKVPDRAGPGPMDGSSVVWMYHSHTDEVGDDYAGLVGPMVITEADAARRDGTPDDVDREFFVQFKVSNENASPYLQRNIDRFAGDPASVNIADKAFEESNLMHSVNGYVFGNLPLDSMTMRKGERVRWYLMGMGTEVDLHTPHWHANTVTALGMRTDVVNLLPASMVVADMAPDDPGTWLFHCHVNDHISAGMMVRYRIDDGDSGQGNAHPGHS
ncbi:FtsP/CotA-like multicopper oxidase with cupredoxin domain [Arthrobacter sp. B3I9]|uniref:multicopper oxidase domain-containing protein n=1 Tax=Arthrobacter sp. B3I9 TaxID=3042270 RepID=UPI0027902B06|nr:multicopper oxidase domain-containing protein [Arthrobacter sp. B3I9]MDQ0849731.1 FtsP/CotA-like multicopper oxidase with cupredoxin domain [Arthrobacter sp. B3I9]